VPAIQRAFPEDGSVEGVPRDERPLGAEQNGETRCLIEDIEDASARRDDGTDARHSIVMARPARRANPLHPARRADDGIVGDGVVGGIVEVVRPFVDFLGAGLYGSCPRIAFLDVSRAVRTQHAHHFGRRDIAEVFGNDEVCEIVNVRQALALERIDGYFAVESL